MAGKFWNFLCVFAYLLYLIVADDSLRSCKSQFLTQQAVKTESSFCTQNCSTSRESDPRFDDLRRHSNNLRHASDAAFIVLPKSTDEVVALLQNAVVNGLRPTVRSGGHCYEDFWSNNTGGILFDMSAMNKMYQLPNDPTIWVESGTRLDRLYETLYKEYGLTAPAGSCLGLGIGGHVAGAGHGVISRKYGVIIDSIDSIELVHVTGNRTVRAVVVGKNSTKEQDKDLFWGLLGGASQNFGIITKIGFRNFPRSPPLVYSYSVKWSLTQNMSQRGFLDFLDKYTRFFANHSAVGSEFCDFSTGLTIGRSQADGPYMSLQALLLGNKRELAEEFFASVGLNASTQNISCREMSYYRYVLEIGGSPISSYMYRLHRSAYMVSSMPLRQREVLWYFHTDPRFSNVQSAWLQIRSYGCAISRVPENGTAYPHRRAVIKIQYGMEWDNAEDAPEQRRWSKGLYYAMYGEKGPKPDDVMDGCFMNYPDGDLVDWQHPYFKDNYARLQKVKKQWDPLNVFHHRQSIELPKT